MFGFLRGWTSQWRIEKGCPRSSFFVIVSRRAAEIWTWQVSGHRLGKLELQIVDVKARQTTDESRHGGRRKI